VSEIITWAIVVAGFVWILFWLGIHLAVVLWVYFRQYVWSPRLPKSHDFNTDVLESQQRQQRELNDV
jgi:hypothetical protein